MDIVPVSTVTAPNKCLRLERLAQASPVEGDGSQGAVTPCGQCGECRRVAVLHLASYALKEEDPQGALLDLLETLGLISGV